jgi:aminopeptidase 2
MASSDDPFRLPTNVSPTHYDVTIKTDLEELTFGGLAIIECVFVPYSMFGIR